jgi:hypothetical protein
MLPALLPGARQAESCCITARHVPRSARGFKRDPGPGPVSQPSSSSAHGCGGRSTVNDDIFVSSTG